MRRRKIKKHFFILNIFLAILLISTIIGISYSFLYTSLDITGTAKGIYDNTGYVLDPDSNPYLEISITLVNKWTEDGLTRYQYQINVKNIGNVTYDNFTILIRFKQNVESPIVWDYGYSLSSKNLTIVNNKYDINPNQTLGIGFAISSNSSALQISTVKITAEETTGEVTLDELNVDFTISSSWGQYMYQYSVKVTNKTGERINYWELDITLPDGTNYVSGWSAIFEVENNILIIKNESYNGRLNNNSSTTFGLQLSTNIENFIPTDIRVFVR